MSYTAPTLRSTGNLITASIYNTDIISNIIAIVAGLIGQGFAAIDLLGATLPSVSAAGHALVAADAAGALWASSNGGPFVPIGTPPYQSPSFICRHRDVVRF